MSRIQIKTFFKYLETTLDWSDPHWFGIYSAVLLSGHGKDIISRHLRIKVERNWKKIYFVMLKRQECTATKPHRLPRDTSGIPQIDKKDRLPLYCDIYTQLSWLKRVKNFLHKIFLRQNRRFSWATTVITQFVLIFGSPTEHQMNLRDCNYGLTIVSFAVRLAAVEVPRANVWKLDARLTFPVAPLCSISQSHVFWSCILQ